MNSSNRLSGWILIVVFLAMLGYSAQAVVADEQLNAAIDKGVDLSLIHI